MLEFKTKTPRSYLLALSGGEAFHTTLLDFARREEIISGSISAMGVLRRAVIDLPATKEQGGRGAPIHLEGPLELSALFGVLASEDGELRLEARATLSRQDELGVKTVGGRLLHAEAEYIELLVTGFADLGLRRDHDERLGLGALRGKGARGGSEAAHHPPRELGREAPVSGWGDAIARASEAELRVEPKHQAEAPNEPRSLREIAEIAARSTEASEGAAGRTGLPTRGDYIEHKVFGVCRVDQMQGDGVMVIRLETGRRKQLKVDALEFLEPRTSGRRTIFPVRLKSAR